MSHTITNDNAHQTLRSLRVLFDEYNSTGFVGVEKYLLESYQAVAHQGLKLCEFLTTKEPGNEALSAYSLFCRKCLMRISYLIHEGRKETTEEMVRWMKGEL